ncbi:hypothetical protein N7U49_00630 [Streptomyces sp. AD2-2]|nr:hypothetical protein N7U49_00630 [Streptomyces sp. AD2-2]
MCCARRIVPPILLTCLLLAGCSSVPLGTSMSSSPHRYLKGEPLEDPKCTPGAVSPAVAQANLKSTMCRKGGYTSGMRPSTYVTGRENRLNAASYGFTGRMSDAEFDHLLSGVVTA